MNADWRNCINQTFGPSRIADIDNYISDRKINFKAPIDIFYDDQKNILSAANPNLLDKNPIIGPLLIVGLVSTTENYFRNIFGKLIKICPIAKKCSADKNINFGSVIWHAGKDFERGAFEHISFAGADNIKKTCNQYLGYKIKDSSQVASVLNEYNAVCELRHGIVHSNLIIAGRNAIKLQLSPTKSHLEIRAGFNEVQECASICTNLVASFNIEIFEVIAKRWAIEWPKTHWWKKENEFNIFKVIWNTFHSKNDEKVGSIPLSLSPLKCKNFIKKEFNTD